MLDHLTILQTQNIEWIEQWRWQQEEKMIAEKGSGMTREQIGKFVGPYIPFTWLIYDGIERNLGKADSVLEIGEDHLPVSISNSQF